MKVRGSITVRRRPKDGEDGKDGKDAWNIVVTPPVVLAADGVIPWTYLKIELFIGGEKVKYNGLGTLLGTTQGTDADTNLYWSWETSYEGTMAYRVRSASGGVKKDFVASSHVVYNGVEYPFSIPFQIVKSGSQGIAGKDIFVMPPKLWEDFPAKYTFLSGDTLDPDGIYRADTVLFMQNGELRMARCRKTHEKSNSHKPDIDNTENTAIQDPYWTTQGGIYQITATQLLMALNGVVKILTSNKICVFNDDGTINTALSGGDWPLWIGAGNPDDAVSKFDRYGGFYCKKATIEGDVVFAGKVLPMETKITDQNYKNYRMETGNYDGISDHCLNFSALTGRVIIDKSFANVSDTECAKIFWLWGQWGQTGSPYPDMWKYVGSSLLVRNEMTSKSIFIDGFGYLSKNPDLASDYVSRLILQPGQEVMLECRLRMVSGARRVGWWISYHGSS